MIEFDVHVAATDVFVVGQILGGHDRTAGHIERIEDRHHFALGVVGGKFIEQRPHQLLIFAPLTDGRKLRIGHQIGHADFRTHTTGECRPHGFLHHHINPVVRAVRLTVNRVAELAAAGIVAGTRHFAHVLIGRHGIFGKRLAREALMIAKFYAAQIHHAVHHRHFDVLALARAIGLMQRGEQTNRQMQSGAGVANLRTGDKWRAVGNTGGAHRAAHGLRDVFIRLEFRIGSAGTKTLDRAHHDFRIDGVDFFPRKSEPVEHAGPEIFHDDVAFAEQVDKYRFAFGRFHVHGDRALVAIEHREIKAVSARHIAQLAARAVTLRRLKFDHVGAHPGQQLRAGRSGLNMRHVEYAYAF